MMQPSIKSANIANPADLTETIAVEINTNVTSQMLFVSAESATTYDISVSFS
jgi:hypothetical protein